RSTLVLLLFVVDLNVGSYFFFFSSRRRHTRSLRDWSSDVCSSDLACHRDIDCAVLLRGRDAPNSSGTVYVTVAGRLLALAEIGKIGRASCRERGKMSRGGKSIKKKKEGRNWL